MSDVSTWDSPAKLNLFLHITSRREDGYHNLQTLFQFLDFKDGLTFTRTTSQKITIAGTKDIPTQQNLIYKAAQKLQSFLPSPLGIHIDIDKKIPLGGGLGGGSSNAATTLVALNQIWQLNLTKQRLLKIALELGADVPVFIHGQASFAQGIGEELIQASPKETYYLITVPPISVSTQKIFNDPTLNRNSPALNFNGLSEIPKDNDCQQTIFKHYPLIEDIYTKLNNHLPTQITGTGACLFTACKSHEEAKKLQQKISFPTFITKGLNQSPLLESLAEFQSKGIF